MSVRASRQVAWIVVFLTCFGLGIFTKQNTLSLPLAVILVEVCFFSLSGQRLGKVVTFAGVGVLALGGACYFLLDPNFFTTLSESTQETDLVSRMQYLAIQMEVLWVYIVKYFFPARLHLDYDIPVTSFTSLVPWMFTLAHLLVIAVAIRYLRRYPIPAFGILFFYVAQSVESSIIPIRDFAFEHRTYLPNFGLTLAVGGCFCQHCQNI